MGKYRNVKGIHAATIKKAGIIGLFAIICVLGIYRCPFKLVFGINCPGCGMTRAFFAALQLDFKTAFQYHPLFWLFGIETAYVIFYEQLSKFIFRNKKVELAIGILSLFLLLIVWFIRQFII